MSNGEHGHGEATADDTRGGAHHLGFDVALEAAVQDWAANRESPTEPEETVEFLVTLRVAASKTNPGRIEKYSVDIVS